MADAVFAELADVDAAAIGRTVGSLALLFPGHVATLVSIAIGVDDGAVSVSLAVEIFSHVDFAVDPSLDASA